MRVTIGLRCENTQEHNTWFSNAHHDPDSTVQLHITRELWLALGQPDYLQVMIDPRDRDPDADAG